MSWSSLLEGVGDLNWHFKDTEGYGQLGAAACSERKRELSGAIRKDGDGGHKSRFLHFGVSWKSAQYRLGFWSNPGQKIYRSYRSGEVRATCLLQKTS